MCALVWENVETKDGDVSSAVPSSLHILATLWLFGFKFTGVSYLVKNVFTINWLF